MCDLIKVYTSFWSLSYIYILSFRGNVLFMMSWDHKAVKNERRPALICSMSFLIKVNRIRIKQKIISSKEHIMIRLRIKIIKDLHNYCRLSSRIEVYLFCNMFINLLCSSYLLRDRVYRSTCVLHDGISCNKCLKYFISPRLSVPKSFPWSKQHQVISQFSLSTKLILLV